MQKAMIRIAIEISGQPIEMAIGPPLFQAWPYVVKHPARIEMIVNEIAKFENPDHARLSVCSCPSSARRCESRSTPSVVGPATVLLIDPLLVSAATAPPDQKV